jgi:hypothetical protein
MQGCKARRGAASKIPRKIGLYFPKVNGFSAKFLSPAKSMSVNCQPFRRISSAEGSNESATHLVRF